MSNENVNTTPENTTTENKEEVKDQKCTLTINPIEFNGQARCLYVSTKALCDMIGSIFKPVMPDYSGCKIRQNVGQPNGITMQLLRPGELYVDLYFKPSSDRPDPETANVILRHSNAKGGEIYNRVASVIGADNKRLYDLSDWTKEVLLDFIHPYAPKLDYKRFNPYWNDRIIEVNQPVSSIPGSIPEVTVCVTGLPLLTFIYYMYGEKIKDPDTGTESEYDYQIDIMRPAFNNAPFPGMSNPSNSEYVLQIARMDRRIKSDLLKVIGYGYQEPLDYNRYGY